MSVNNGKITPPISIDDVKSVLGESSNDVATLCKSTNINKWARYKPVHILNTPFCDIKTSYRGTAGNCGITVPSGGTVEAIIDYYNKNDNGYAYTLPSGGAASPYRLGDFLGYNHNAYAPFSSLFVNGTKFGVTDKIMVSAGYYYPYLKADDCLLLEDFSSLENCYFGAALVKDGSVAYCYTMDKVIKGVEDLEVTFAKSGNWVQGSYSIVPFLSTARYSSLQTGSTMAGTYYPLPVMKPKTISIVSTSESVSVSVTITATYASSSKTTVIVSIKNNGKEGLKDVYVDCRLSAVKDYNDGLVMGEDSKVIDTILAGHTESVTFTNVGNVVYNGKLCFCNWGTCRFKNRTIVKRYHILYDGDE